MWSNENQESTHSSGFPKVDMLRVTGELFDHCQHAGQAYTSLIKCLVCQQPINNAMQNTKISQAHLLHYREVTNDDLSDLDRLGLTNYCYFQDNQWVLDVKGKGVNQAPKRGVMSFFILTWNGDAEGCIVWSADKSHHYNLYLNPSLQSSHQKKGQNRTA